MTLTPGRIHRLASDHDWLVIPGEARGSVVFRRGEQAVEVRFASNGRLTFAQFTGPDGVIRPTRARLAYVASWLSA